MRWWLINNNWIYYIKIYFDYLVKANSYLFQLIGLNGKQKSYCREKKYLEIFDLITKIIPISASLKEQKAIIRDIDKKSGIFELIGNDLPEINKKYDEIIEKYNKELFNIKMIRNKFEHCPHCILTSSNVSIGHWSSLSMTFKTSGKQINYDNIEYYECNAEDLKNIIYELNSIFSILQDKIRERCNNNDNYLTDCLEINFSYYNDIIFNENFLKFCIISSKF